MTRFLKDSHALFQHIPRTGGTFIEDALGILGLNVSRWLHKAPKHLPRKHSLTTHYPRTSMAEVEHIFAFVRNPLDYYVTTWRWMAAQSPRKWEKFMAKWTWHPHLSVGRFFMSPPSLEQPAVINAYFNEWAAKTVKYEPGWVTRLFESFVGPQGGEICSFIGRTETLESDLLLVLKALGYDITGFGDTLVTMPPSNAAKVPKPEWYMGILADVQKGERPGFERWEVQNLNNRFYGLGGEQLKENLANGFRLSELRESTESSPLSLGGGGVDADVPTSGLPRDRSDGLAAAPVSEGPTEGQGE